MSLPHRLLVVFGSLLVALAVSMPVAWAHAVVLDVTPADESIFEEAPAQAQIQFNEPVSILVLSLVGPGGEQDVVTDFRTDGGLVEFDLPAEMDEGTHAVSWRVMSSDGHPVNGSAIFSIGEPSAVPAAQTSDPVVSTALWLSKVLLYAGLFVGAGSAASRAFLAPVPERLKAPILTVISCGIIAVLAGLALQGLDALGLGIGAATDPDMWITGFNTGYGLTMVCGLAAMATGVALLFIPSDAAARIAGWTVLALSGLAFAATGHASTAAPQWLTRPSVFLHATAITFWIGSLVPLFFHMLPSAPHGAVALRRFSDHVPYAAVLLVGSGLILMTIQTGLSPSSILTQYGTLLAIKLALVVVLFGMASWNRLALTAPSEKGDEVARARLRRTVIAELSIVIVIFGVVAGWRFTPPPRALAQQSSMTTEDVITHVHNDRDPWGAWVTFQPTGGNSGTILIEPLGENDVPIVVEDVTIALSREDIGVEPFERQATALDPLHWAVEDVILPAAGSWQVSITMRLSAFEQTIIGGDLFLDSMPAPSLPSDVVIALEVVDGVLQGLDETIRVQAGQQVELVWTVDAPQFVHLHGYDILLDIPPGTPTSMEFVANIPGRFPIETHGRTAGNVAYLEVLP